MSIDLEAIKARAEAATPGPWWHEWVDGDDWWAVYGQPTGDMVCPEVCTMWSSDEAAYIAAVNPAVVLGLVAEIERLAGEPTEDEVERAARAINPDPWNPRRWPFVGHGETRTLDESREAERDATRSIARAALRAARGLS